MKLVELIIMAMFDIITYIVILRKMISYEKPNKKTYIIFTLIFSILVGLSRRYLPGNYGIVMSWLLVMGMVFILYKQSIKQTIYLYITGTIVILLIQFLVIIILYIIGGKIEFIFLDGLVAQSIGLLFAVLTSIYLPINFIFKYIISNKIFKYLALNMLVILFSLLLYWNIDIDGVFKNIISIAVISLGIIYVNFVLIRSGIKGEYEKRQLQTYEKYLPVIDELIDELRIKQHEFDNHIQALKMLVIASTDYESITSSMKDYIKDLQIDTSLGSLIKLNNKVLAGFLYSNIKKAEDLNIRFQIIIEDYGFNVRLKDYELVEVIGNLMNNAFETGVENNVVILELYKEKDMNVIEIRNKHPYLKKENIGKMFNKGFSTKSYSERGFGLYNIKEILKRYGSEIEIFNEIVDEDNYIVFRILSPGS